MFFIVVRKAVTDYLDKEDSETRIFWRLQLVLTYYYFKHTKSLFTTRCVILISYWLITIKHWKKKYVGFRTVIKFLKKGSNTKENLQPELRKMWRYACLFNEVEFLWRMNYCQVSMLMSLQRESFMCGLS